MHIDDLPVGLARKSFMIEEYPPDFDPKQQEKVDLPLKQRLKSKVWKVRLQAYEELVNDPELDVECALNIIQDIHVQCQERALQISSVFFENNTAIEATKQKELYKILLEKVLTQPKLKQSGNQVAIQMFPHCRASVFEIIILQLSHKNPKVVQATIALLIELLQQYGLKKLDNLKPFFPIMAKLTEAQQSTIKADAVAFFKEVTKWYGKNIEAFFGGLSDKLQQELKKQAESITEVLKAPKQEEEVGPGNQELYDLVEPVEVFAKFQDSWCEKVFQLEKWQERKEQLDILHKACSIPKIIPSQHVYPVVQLLKKLINEQNITISTFCIKIVGCISSGLRKHFNQYAKMLMLSVLNKLKDKKQNVVDETISTVRKMFYCCSLDEFFEDFKALLEDKAPGPKINVFILIEAFLEENNKEKLTKQQCIKALIPICKKFAEDGNSEVRAKSVTVLAKISAKLFNGSLQSDFKGEKQSKYQAQVSAFLDVEKLAQGNNKQSLPSQTQNPPPPPPPPQQSKIQHKLTQPNQIIIEQNIKEEPQYSPNMTPTQVEQFLKTYKQQNKLNNELGNILMQITQTSKIILQITMEYLVDKMGEQKQLCHQLFDKCGQQYSPNHIVQLIITFRTASTQSQLIEILSLLLKHIPLCDKTQLDQIIVNEFLKIYQNQTNQKTKQLVQDCQSAMRQLYEPKKVPIPEQKPQILPPFPLHCFCELQFERLKEQLRVPQIPPQLHEKLFSHNITKNTAAASYIKQKIVQPGEFGQLFFKWAYMISWMRESIPLQTEIALLLQMLLNQNNSNPLDRQIIFSYIKMMILLYFRGGMPKLAQRTLPLLMNILADCKQMGIIYTSLPKNEEFDDLSNQQANEFLKLMFDNSLEWGCNNLMQQKQIIAQLLGIISKEESVIIKKSLSQCQQPQAQILPKQINCENSSQIMQIPKPEAISIEQQNQDKKVLQPSQLNGQIIASNQSPMELEQDQSLKTFLQIYIQFREGHQITEPLKFADLILQLLGSLLNDQQYDKINPFLEKLVVLLSRIDFLGLISYEQFYQIFQILFFKMIEEANKQNKETLNRGYYNLLNQNLIKILNNQELSLLYITFLDLLIKIKESGTQSKQFFQLITKCLKKSLDSLKGQFQWQQVVIILEKIEKYLNLCSTSACNPDFAEFQNFVISALKSTVTHLIHYNDRVKVYQAILNITNEQSLLRFWVQEYKDAVQGPVDLNKHRRSFNISAIVDLLKIDFEKSVDQFVNIVRRQNINWKPQVTFLTQQQVDQIEFKLEQTSHMHSLEKKVGELERMLNQ